MRKINKIPKILKIEGISGHTIQCMFNNGESRLIDFKEILKEWNVKKGDIEYPLLNQKEFQKVKLRNQTLSWPNIEVSIENENGITQVHPYEVDPIILFQKSKPTVDKDSMIGNLIKEARIKAGLTQEQLALKSGTSRFHISRIENNKTDIELSTIRKIIIAGLDKHLKLKIE